MLTVDYYKFFDSFDHAWVLQYLELIKFPPAMVEIIYDLYVDLWRTIKIGNAYGESFQTHNGMGQGDIFSSPRALRWGDALTTAIAEATATTSLLLTIS